MNELTKLPASVADAQSIFDLVKFATADEKIDAAKLHSLLDAQERILKKQAEQAYNEGVARVVASMPKIVKNKRVLYDIDKSNPAKGKAEAFSYAPLEDIDKVVKPLLRANELRDSYTTSAREGGGAVVITKLTHALGHSDTCELPLPLDTSGGKNNVQAMGSTFSYGRRMGICGILGIVVIGQDDDGQTSEPISPNQVIEVEDLLTASGLDRSKFLRLVKAESIENIQSKDFARAINALKAAIYDKKKPE